jgi:hypothetical protein
MLGPISAFLVALITLASGGIVTNVEAQNQGLYALVPEAERESLRASVERMIALRKAGKWDELFDLLDHQQHLTKVPFIRQARRQAKLIEFVPATVTYYPPGGIWSIHGCAVLSPPLRGRQGGVFSSFDAHQTAAGWRFGPIAVVLLKDEPGGTRPCTPDTPGGVPRVGRGVGADGLHNHRLTTREQQPIRWLDARAREFR